MDRYTRIQSVTFGQTALPLPLSVRLRRHCEAAPAGGDADLFATSVQLNRPSLVAEVRVRGTNVAEALTLGQKDTLSVTVAPARSGQAGRTITLAGAVLASMELIYEQASMAMARLRFVAESADGATDPFSAEDAQ